MAPTERSTPDDFEAGLAEYRARVKKLKAAQARTKKRIRKKAKKGRPKKRGRRMGEMGSIGKKQRKAMREDEYLPPRDAHYP